MKRKLMDITGQKFNSLTAIKPLRKKSGTSRIWLCKCDCGNTSKVSTNNLLRNNVKSCGCYRLKNQYRTIENQAFYYCKQKAEERNYKFNLTREEYLEKVRKKCVYCNKIGKKFNKYSGVFLELNSLDRINNEPFYSVKNTQPVCVDCQYFKMDWKDAEFKTLIKTIYEFLKLDKK